MVLTPARKNQKPRLATKNINSTKKTTDSGITDNEDGDENEIDDEAEEILKEKQIDSKIDALDENELEKLTAKDCEDECKSKKDDDEKYDLCQAYCGLSKNENDSNSDCTEEEDLEADKCWKEKAINEKNGDWCEKIENEELEENCFNRLIEEIFD